MDSMQYSNKHQMDSMYGGTKGSVTKHEERGTTFKLHIYAIGIITFYPQYHPMGNLQLGHPENNKRQD
jgi:hypothetical protein